MSASAVTNHLIRRGIEGFQARNGSSHMVSPSSATAAGGEKIHIPAWAATLLAVTVLIFTFTLFATQYTYGAVVTTLAAVEAPGTTAIIRTAPDDNEEEADAALLSGNEKGKPEHELLSIKQRPLTSRFCAIKRHLRARGGRGARFRGLHIYILNLLLLNIINQLLSSVFKGNLEMGALVVIVTTTLLTPISLLWNHIVISEPSSRTWIQRMAPRAIVIKALAPTAAFEAIDMLSTLVLIHAINALESLSDPRTAQGDTVNHPNLLLILTIISTILIILFRIIAIQIPAEIAIARVRASLLAADEEPIIPMDRTFNNQTIPSTPGGTAKLTLYQAWRSCPRETYLRVLGVHGKVTALQMALLLLGCGVVAAELRLALGLGFGDGVHAFATQIGAGFGLSVS